MPSGALRSPAVRDEDASYLLSRRERRRYQQSLVFGVANGGLLLLGDALIHPLLVLALFVDQLSGSGLLVGLVPVLSVGLWFLPQGLAAALVQGRRRQLHWAAWASLVRALAIGVFTVALFIYGVMPSTQLLVLFFLCYGLYSLAAGFAFVPTVELVARAVPANRRGFFFSQRNFWGALLALLAGLVVERALAQGTGGFVVLFAASFAVLALSAYTTLWIIERPRAGRPASFRTWLAALPDVLLRRSVRRFLLVRSFLALATIADPFFVIYALRVLGLPADAVGLFLLLSAVARVVSNPLWGWITQRWGNRLLLQLTALLRFSMPIAVIGIQPLLLWGSFREAFGNPTRVVVIVFGIVFFLYGAAVSAQMLANFTAVLELARPDERPTMVGVTNTILGVVALVPLLGGVVVDWLGFAAVFVLAFVFSLLAVLASGLLPRRPLV